MHQAKVWIKEIWLHVVNIVIIVIYKNTSETKISEKCISLDLITLIKSFFWFYGFVNSTE